jgi:protein-S-isoprenylcysteine O-methyltransferase Ste14
MEARAERRKQKRWAFIQPFLTTFQSISISFSMYFNYVKSDSTKDLKWNIFRILLLVITIISYILWLISRFQLGRHLTFAAKAQSTFVRKGMYAHFRNPIYIFGTLALTSYILLLNRPIFLCILFVLVPFQIVRSLQERRVLRKKFGDDYDDYVKRLWF